MQSVFFWLFTSPVANWLQVLKYNKWTGIPLPCILLKRKEDHKYNCHVYILLLFSCLLQPEVFKSELFAQQRPISSSDLIIKCGGRYRLVLCVHLWMCAIELHGSICKPTFMSFFSLDRSFAGHSSWAKWGRNVSLNKGFLKVHYYFVPYGCIRWFTK